MQSGVNKVQICRFYTTVYSQTVIINESLADTCRYIHNRASGSSEHPALTFHLPGHKSVQHPQQEAGWASYKRGHLHCSITQWTLLLPIPALWQRPTAAAWTSPSLTVKTWHPPKVLFSSSCLLPGNAAKASAKRCCMYKGCSIWH